jgi:hypothetical protein
MTYLSAYQGGVDNAIDEHMRGFGKKKDVSISAVSQDKGFRQGHSWGSLLKQFRG